MRSSTKSGTHRHQLLLTCEHAGNRIPREYAHIFKGAEELLASHRGWDPGALDLTRRLAKIFTLPFFHVMWTRLLVESNRAPTNRRIWSSFTADLPAAEKKRVLEKYWWPNRHAVEAFVKNAAKQKRPVFHVAVHSFTNVLNGVQRNADIGILYDPARRTEKDLCTRWEQILNELDPTIRVRRNYPYRGEADGLPTWLRRKFSDRAYSGVEFEFNQALVGTPRFAHVSNVIAESIKRLLG